MATHATGVRPRTTAADPPGWRIALILVPAAVILLGHAWIPLAEFIHRGDDAFYYFQVALNHVRYGFWTFDGVNPTNGVQPIWAWMLTGLAHLAALVGIREPEAFARLAVLLNGLLYLAAIWLLAQLLARTVSVGTGLAVAGSMLLPLGVVWGRSWGMESAVYLLLLVMTVSWYHLEFRTRPTVSGAVLLGALLGACMLGRLNGGLFVAILLTWFAFAPGERPRRERFGFGFIAGAVAATILLGYLAWNHATTGHLLPISGAVKTVRAAEARAEYGVESLRNVLSMIYYGWREGALWLFSSRVLDGFWVVGVRIFHQGAAPLAPVLALLALAVLGPSAAGDPGGWGRLLRERLRRLAPLGYFAVFAVGDAAVAALVYPSELYAATRWWLTPLEVVITVVTVTVLVAALCHLANRWVAVRLQARVMVAGIVLLGLVHLAQFVQFYWDGRVTHPDWNLSWNDSSLRAAEWMSMNLPADARVGAWNAGVVGYFSPQPLTNLDGLINNFELLPYLRERRIEAYLEVQGIEYLADMEAMFVRQGVRDRLPLVEVYRQRSAFYRGDYVIYRVER